MLIPRLVAVCLFPAANDAVKSLLKSTHLYCRQRRALQRLRCRCSCLPAPACCCAALNQAHHCRIEINVDDTRNWQLHTRRVLTTQAHQEGYRCAQELLERLREEGNIHRLEAKGKDERAQGFSNRDEAASPMRQERKLLLEHEAAVHQQEKRAHRCGAGIIGIRSSIAADIERIQQRVQWHIQQWQRRLR